MPKNSLTRLEDVLGVRLQETNVGGSPDDAGFVARVEKREPGLRDASKDEFLAEMARRIAAGEL